MSPDTFFLPRGDDLLTRPELSEQETDQWKFIFGLSMMRLRYKKLDLVLLIIMEPAFLEKFISFIAVGDSGQDIILKAENSQFGARL